MARTSQQNTRGNYLIVGVIALVAIAVVVALAVFNRPPSPPGDAGDTITLDESIPRGLTDDGFPYLGNPDAPVTMLIYEDLGCPNCRNLHRDVEPSVIENYIIPGNVRLVIFNIAFVSSQSLPGAEGAACASDQGKFWEYRQLLFENLGIRPFDRQNLVEFAESAGLDRRLFANCFDQELYAQEILDRSQTAFNFGITGTPTIDVNGERHVGMIPYDGSTPIQPSMKEILDKVLQKVEE